MPDNAFIGAGISRGALAAFQAHRENTSPELRERRREAKQRADLSQARLDEFEQDAPVREAQRESKIAKAEQDVYASNAQLARQQSFDSFRMYEADGDPRHLNNWLQQSKSNPVSRGVTAGMTRFDRLARTPEHEKLLREAGITDIEGFYSDPDLMRSYVIGTDPSGNAQLVDMNRMYAVSGYAQYTTEQEQKKIQSNSLMLQRLRQGGNVSEIRQDDAIVGQLATAMDLPRDEVYRLLREQPSATTGRGSSTIERVAEELRSENPELSYRDSLVQAAELTTRPRSESLTNEERFVRDYQERNPEASREDAVAAFRQAGRDDRTAPIKNVEFAEEAAAALDEAYGGNFLTADLANETPEQEKARIQAIRRMEQVGGLELSSEEKKNARAIRKVLSLGKTAGERLTPAQTGPIDSMLRSVKTYISDNVDGKDATTAYEAFRAIARNALFGSQVSGADYSAFNKAFASLEQQTGPVLVSLRTQLEVMRDDLQAMADLNDPYVTKARFGVTLDEADDIINALQDRIDIINAVANGRPLPSVDGQSIKLPATDAAGGGSGIQVNVTPTTPGETPPAERPSLDSIFGGAQ